MEIKGIYLENLASIGIIKTRRRFNLRSSADPFSRIIKKFVMGNTEKTATSEDYRTVLGNFDGEKITKLIREAAMMVCLHCFKAGHLIYLQVSRRYDEEHSKAH